MSGTRKKYKVRRYDIYNTMPKTPTRPDDHFMDESDEVKNLSQDLNRLSLKRKWDENIESMNEENSDSIQPKKKACVRTTTFQFNNNGVEKTQTEASFSSKENFFTKPTQKFTFHQKSHSFQPVKYEKKF